MDLTISPLAIVQRELNEIAAGLVALTPNLVAGLIILAVTWLAAVIAGRAAGVILARERARPSLRRALVSLTKIGLWVAGALVTAAIVFPNLTPTRLLTGLGIGSIAVGLAFRDIFENFLAGLLILFREPMRIGDDVECEGVEGVVEEITIRDTYIRQRSGELVLVPNAFIFKNQTRILTDRPKRRISLVVGVAYGEDVAEAHRVISRALDGLETVDDGQAVEVFATAFASSSVDFLVRWWTGSRPVDELNSRSEVVTAIKRALNEAGIEIPFPHRTLTFSEPLQLARAEADGVSPRGPA